MKVNRHKTETENSQAAFAPQSEHGRQRQGRGKAVKQLVVVVAVMPTRWLTQERMTGIDHRPETVHIG